MPIPVLYQDPFAPALRSSPPVNVTDEQKFYVREVLSICSSDEQFAEKAYKAITRILTGGSVVVPTLSSLSPASAEVGDPSFTLHVHGNNFTPLSKIYFNGGEEPTTFVSSSELTTGVDMSTVSGASVVPVVVLSEDGIQTSPLDFAFTI